MHIHAAVDADGLAGHEVAIIGSEEDYGADQIGGLLIALERTALSAVGELLGARDAFLVGAGDGQAGHNGIHTDVVAADFPRERPGET